MSENGLTEKKSFVFTPARVVSAIRAARETGERHVWRDESKDGPHLQLVVGARTARFYYKGKRDGREKVTLLGSAEGPDAIPLGEARARSNGLHYGADLAQARPRKGKVTRTGITPDMVWPELAREMEVGTFSMRRSKVARPYAEKTRVGYLSNYRAHIQPEYGGKDLGRLLADAESIVRGIESWSVSNQVLASLNILFEYARRRGHISAANPLRALDENPRRSGHRTEAQLTGQQVEKVREAISDLGDYWADLFLFLALSGRRVGNATNLRWDQVDLEGGLITYYSSGMKGRRASTLPMTKSIRALLKRRREQCPEGSPWVWPALKDPSQPIRDVYHQWGKVRQASGLPEIQPKWLRHLAVTWALRGNVSAPIVQQMADHKHAQTTAGYTHLAGHDTRPALEAVEQVWTKPKSKRGNHGKT